MRVFINVFIKMYVLCERKASLEKGEKIGRSLVVENGLLKFDDMS